MGTRRRPSALAIERHPEPQLAGVERVFDEVDALAGDALAQAPGERAAPLLDLGGGDRDGAQPLEQLGDRFGLEDDVVFARFERRGRTRGLAEANGARGLFLEAQRAHVAVYAAARARGAAGPRGLERPDPERRHGRVVRSGAPARRGHGVRRARRLEHPGANQALGAHGAQHGQEALDALFGRGVRGGRFVARGILRGTVARVCVAREAGEPLDLGHEPRGARRRANRLDERRALEAARHGFGHTAAVGDSNRGQRLGELHVLPELSAREARAPPLGDPDVELGLGLARLGEHLAAKGEQRFAVHDALPTVTPRKRAGEAPWPTCMDCIGSPLPHVERPQRRQASGPQMASHPPQKRGVIPV